MFFMGNVTSSGLLTAAPKPIITQIPTNIPLPPDTALSHIQATSSLSMLDTRTGAQRESYRVEPVDTISPTHYPARLLIPSIKLDTPIVNVGQNNKGEMDVPSGRTNNVGWYADGTIPGDIGSAVLDAHVFAAFHRLHKLKEGADVYVISDDGSKLHFQVSYRRVYPLSDVPLDKLFQAKDAKRLNLITCAGSLTKNRSTYDHRLIVYTTLASD